MSYSGSKPQIALSFSYRQSKLTQQFVLIFN